MSVARPYWMGDKKRTAWGLLALLIGLMVLETQLAVMLIDKTGDPDWSPPTPSEVTAEMVDAYFQPLPADQAWSPLPPTAKGD